MTQCVISHEKTIFVMVQPITAVGSVQVCFLFVCSFVLFCFFLEKEARILTLMKIYYYF